MTLHINDNIISKNHNSRIIHLIMHYTVLDFHASIKALTEGEVSAHYLIAAPDDTSDTNLVYRLVPDIERAWHAGASHWGKRSNLNDSSIGIEHVNPGFTEQHGVQTWYPYPTQQILQSIALSQELVKRYAIAPHFVLGHSDIAIGRKLDPGIDFPWEQFHHAGVGAWPDAANVRKYWQQFAGNRSWSIDSVTEKLHKYGYVFDSEIDFKTVMSAFQMHFRPSNYSGHADDESVAILYALVEKYIPA
jgi:N-acetylmuramoyl-L-alanine amidase